MLSLLLRAIDALSRALGAVSMGLLVLLVASMTFEVVSRRLFDAPTLWAYDVSSMANGVVFVLALAVVLQQRAHIRVDFLSSMFPPRVQLGIELLFFGLLLAPLLAVLAATAWAEAWDAFATGRVDRVSPWAPLMWPYFTGLAIGLSALLLQCTATAIRAALGLPSGRPLHDPAPEAAEHHRPERSA